MFERGFYGLCGLPSFFSRILTIHFAEMIAKKQAITYNDDVILQAKTKTEMWNNLESYFPKLFLIVLILSEKARTLTMDENGKVHQLLWKQTFMKTITQKMSLIAESVTMMHPMRTLL